MYFNAQDSFSQFLLCAVLFLASCSSYSVYQNEPETALNMEDDNWNVSVNNEANDTNEDEMEHFGT